MRIRLPLFCVLYACLVPAMAGVYRCDTPDGAAFQDRPCGGGTAVVVDDSGYSSGSGLRASERRWLKEHRGRKPPKTKVVTSGRSGDRKAQARRCWNKQARLEAVRARLRRGYKASQGDRLRRQRRNYEDYLSRFCD